MSLLCRTVEKYSGGFVLTCWIRCQVLRQREALSCSLGETVPPWAVEWPWSWSRACLKRDYVKYLPRSPFFSGQLPAKDHSRPLLRSSWLVLEDDETLNNHEIHVLVWNLVTARQGLWLSSPLGICPSVSLKPVVLLKDGEGSTSLEKYMRLCIFPFSS